jgi:hypothetical protein
MRRAFLPFPAHSALGPAKRKQQKIKNRNDGVKNLKKEIQCFFFIYRQLLQSNLVMWNQCGSGSSILGQCGCGSSSGSWSAVLMTKHFISQLKKIYFSSKIAISYPQASMKDFQATGETFNPQKRTSSISKHEISSLVSIFFTFLPSWIRIRIQPTKIHADPYASESTTVQHWSKH